MTLPTTIRSSNRPAEPHQFGSACPSTERVATDVWAYLLDDEGQETGYIGRVRGRMVKDIAADLSKAIHRVKGFEWATLGQSYKYHAFGDTPETECPKGSVVVYVTHGGSEGHLVHVDVLSIIEGSAHRTARTIFMVKTLSGVASAKRIATRLEKLLNVL